MPHRKERPMPLPQTRLYTIDDIYALPDGERAELMDGKLYMMAPPSRIHQKISGGIFTEIYHYIRKNNGNCEIYAAPFAVFLTNDNINYLEPDLSIICDPSKLDEKGCHGAPDWIIEITSPSNPQTDYGIKLFKYRNAGVREYWIVNPLKKTVMVYDFEKQEHSNQYNFDDDVPVCIFDDLIINIDKLLY